MTLTKSIRWTQLLIGVLKSNKQQRLRRAEKQPQHQICTLTSTALSIAWRLCVQWKVRCSLSVFQVTHSRGERLSTRIPTLALCPPRILDRGQWSTTALSKGYAYIFNTTPEDQAVAKTLSRWQQDQTPLLPNFSKFDELVLPRVRSLQTSLFPPRDHHHRRHHHQKLCS